MTPSQIAVNDIGTAEDFLAAIEGTIKNFNDGDLVSGIVVQIDREEVLLDIGYKTEGVIPSRELSIRHDVDPSELVKVGDRVEALVLQKEDKEEFINNLKNQIEEMSATDEIILSPDLLSTLNLSGQTKKLLEDCHSFLPALLSAYILSKNVQ